MALIPKGPPATPIQAGATEKGGNFADLLRSHATPHSSTEELGASLAARMQTLCMTVAQQEGFHLDETVFDQPVVETNFQEARSSLSALMRQAREGQIATITRRGRVDDAVALIDVRTFELVIGLAEKALVGTQHFGDLGRVTIDADTAAQLSPLRLQRPLPERQSAADRRRALAEFRGERAEASFQVDDQPGAAAALPAGRISHS